MIEADLPWWVALPAALLLVTGALLALVGSLGLLRLRSFYARMHGPAMGATLGLYLTLAAAMLVAWAVQGKPVLQPVLIAVFMLLTAPVTALLLMQAGIYRERRQKEK